MFQNIITVVFIGEDNLAKQSYKYFKLLLAIELKLSMY